MSHEITIRENGKAEMAFIGDRSRIWHGLGNELAENMPIEQWVIEAGMDWDVFESAVQFCAMNADGSTETIIYPKRKALFRSDTKAPLSIVSDDYKIVQPRQVLEFFRDLVEIHGMKLSTAGTLYGGTRFWALAELGKEITLANDDKVNGNLLLTTSVDRSVATTAKFVSTRVVCNNTLTVALNENAKSLVKRTHKTEWDPESIKIDLGLIDSSWELFAEKIDMLVSTPLSDEEVRDFYQETFFDPEAEIEDQKWGATRKVNQLMELYNSGAGAAEARGNAWGALNAITNMFTHGSGKRDPSNQFWDGFNGSSEKIKMNALEDLLDMA